MYRSELHHYVKRKTVHVIVCKGTLEIEVYKSLKQLCKDYNLSDEYAKIGKAVKLDGEWYNKVFLIVRRIVKIENYNTCSWLRPFNEAVTAVTEQVRDEIKQKSASQ